MIDKHKIILLSFFTLIIFLYIFNLYVNGNQSLWSDEAFSANVASKSIGEIIRISTLDTLPPLHIILLHFWIKIFSNSEIAIRSLSTIFSISSLIVYYKLTTYIFKKSSERLISLMFFSANSLMLYYAVEARPYSLVIFFTTLLVYSVILRIKANNFATNTLFIFASIAGLYSHSIFSIIFTFIFFWDLFLNYTYDKLFFKEKKYIKLIFYYAIVGILFLPWILQLLFTINRANSDGFWVQFKPITDLLNTYIYFFTMYVDVKSVFIGIAIIIYTLGTFFFIRTLFIKQKNYYITQLFITFIAFIWLLSFKIPLFYIRYLLFLLPLFALIISTGFISSKKFLKTKPWALLGIIFISSQLLLYFATTPIKADYRVAIHDIDKDTRKKLVLHGNAASFHAFSYYQSAGYIYDPEKLLPYYQGLANVNETDYFTKNIQDYDVIYVPKVWSEEPLNSFLTQNNFVKTDEKDYDYPLEIETWSKL